MNCKKCGHPDYSHHAVTGRCGASIVRMAHDWQMHEDSGIRWYCNDYEVEGECQCIYPGFESRTPKPKSSLDAYINENAAAAK